MSWHRFEIEIEVDDAELAKHPGDSAPPPNDPSEWDGSDIFAAARLGLFSPVDVEICDYTCLGNIVTPPAR